MHDEWHDLVETKQSTDLPEEFSTAMSQQLMESYLHLKRWSFQTAVQLLKYK